MVLFTMRIVRASRRWVNGRVTTLMILLGTLTVAWGAAQTPPAAIPLGTQLQGVPALGPPSPGATREPLEAQHLFYGAKIGFGMLMAGTALTAPDSTPMERAVVGGAGLLVGGSSAAVWYHSRRGNAAATRGWRTASFIIDLFLSSALATYGAWVLAGGDVHRQYAGLAALTTGLATAAISTANLVPFRFETRARRAPRD